MKPLGFMSPAYRILTAVFVLAGALTQTSCVHEFPENTMPKRDITLTIRHLQEWTHTEMTVTRQDAAAVCRYHLKAYPAGLDQVSAAEFVFFRTDLDRNDSQ